MCLYIVSFCSHIEKIPLSCYEELSALLDRIKFKVRDYSVPAFAPFDAIDRRFNIDPQLQRQIKYATVVVCSNRPANSNGMASDEIQYALSIGKPVVAVRVTDSTSSIITSLGIPVVAKRKDALENWILRNA